MSVFKRSILYLRRKKARTLLLFIILFSISTAILSGVTVKKASQASREQINESLNASFDIGMDLRNNLGIGDRGFGNVDQDIVDKVAGVSGIRDYNMQLIGESNMDDVKKVPLEQARVDYGPEKEAFLAQYFDLEGMRKSELDHKFISQVLKLTAGRHIQEDDIGKVLVHEDFAKLNNLSLHDKISYRNESSSSSSVTTTGELEIVGLFSGTNKTKASHHSELFENEMITDLQTAKQLRGYEEKAFYQSATFFLKDPKEIDTVIKNVSQLDVDWQRFDLFKSDQTYMGLVGSLDSLDKIINQLLIGVFIVSVIILTVILWFWLSTRIHEAGILLSIGHSKFNVIGQFMIEVMLIAALSFSLSFFTSDKIANNIGESMIKQAQRQTEQEQNQAMGGMNFGSDANTSVLTKTIDELDISITARELKEVALMGSVIILFSVGVASAYIVRMKPKEILSKMS